MKPVFIKVKSYQTHALIAIAVLSLLLTIYDWPHLQLSKLHTGNITWVTLSLLFTEAFFIVGAVLMAVSAGETLVDIRKLHRLPKRLLELRRDARVLAKKLLVNRLFTIGFWANFIGAVGTSVILIIAVLRFAPYTGAGLLLFLIIDLAATFGWRVPLEIERRKAHRHGY